MTRWVDEGVAQGVTFVLCLFLDVCFSPSSLFGESFPIKIQQDCGEGCLEIVNKFVPFLG